jgi:2Fe-2S ferredoxin
MPTVNYLDANGVTHSADVPIGDSVMRGAKDNGIEGIDADCGGVCACATCHVYVDALWFDRIGAPGPDEEEMLDCVTDRTPTSRLSCQIALTAEMDGLIVRLPETQR